MVVVVSDVMLKCSANSRRRTRNRVVAPLMTVSVVTPPACEMPEKALEPRRSTVSPAAKPETFL
jgi:hypothetical protein